jgi:formylglycine-generating enzyme required for sulfatase activity
MLEIPPGCFTMGSPHTEKQRSADEGPQRLVTLDGFMISQTPITQAQWRAVATWRERPGERWQRPLPPNPSRFQWRQGDRLNEVRLEASESNTDQRPVERVSWWEAMEFCHRLNQRLRQRIGRHYSLPSEAQWEYACRAGTTTAFHFGATLTPQLANYDGSYTYASGPEGIYRKQTTPVGMFPANSWGLHDMHGNVLEWCLDHWHPSYRGAPTDGSAWVEPDAQGSLEVKQNSVPEMVLASPAVPEAP